MPVAISIILDRSQIDAGFLIQVERNEKALRRIQEKIMHTRSTLDWTQSSNIFVKYIKLVFDWTVYLVLVDRDDLRGFWKF